MDGRFRARRRAPALAAAATLAAAVAAAVAAVAIPPARAAAAGAPRVAVEAVPPTVTVGDPVEIRITATLPDGWTLIWPPLAGAWGPFEVRAVGPRAAWADGGGVTERRVITATAFTTGTLATPPLTLDAVDAAGAAHAVAVGSVDVVVRSVLGADDRTARPPRGPVALPVPARWPLVAGLLGAIAALAAALAWALRRLAPRRAPAAAAPEPALDFATPLDRARAALDALRRDDLPGRGRTVAHYDRLADILRVFAEGALGVPARERTTAELSAALDQLGAHDAAAEPLLAVLGDADLVKFARIVPDAATARASLADAADLVGPLWAAAERRRIAAEAAAAAGAGAPRDDLTPRDVAWAADGDGEAAA